MTVDSGLKFDACGNLWMVTDGGALYEVDPETAQPHSLQTSGIGSSR